MRILDPRSLYHRRAHAQLPTGAYGADAREEPGERRSPPFVPPPVELVR
jgi:hypothetical protein